MTAKRRVRRYETETDWIQNGRGSSQCRGEAGGQNDHQPIMKTGKRSLQWLRVKMTHNHLMREPAKVVPGQICAIPENMLDASCGCADTGHIAIRHNSSEKSSSQNGNLIGRMKHGLRNRNDDMISGRQSKERIGRIRGRRV